MILPRFAPNSISCIFLFHHVILIDTLIGQLSTFGGHYALMQVDNTYHRASNAAIKVIDRIILFHSVAISDIILPLINHHTSHLYVKLK